MLSYHNDIKVKEKYLSRVQKHYEADEIIKGVYWEKGKGCAVGCTLHSANHTAYETELGIPFILALLEDGIFEGLPLERSKIWPKEFLEAINVGVDLSSIWPKFAVWLLTDDTHGVLRFAKSKESKDIINNVADYYKNYKITTHDQWKKAYTAADDYVSDYAPAFSDYVAYYAASAYFSSAAAAAESATTIAVDAAVDAVVNPDDDDDDTYDDVREKTRVAQADKLLELLRGCE